MAKDDKPEQEPLTPVAATVSDPNSVPAAPSAAKKIKKILLIALPIILSIAAGLFFFFKIIRSPKNYEDAHKDKAVATAAEVIQNTYVDIEQMLIGLSASGTKPNYLRITMALQVGNELDTKAVQAKMPVLVDTFQTFLRSLRANDFNSSGSTIYLKEELLKRANKVTSPIIVKDVLFKELMVN